MNALWNDLAARANLKLTDDQHSLLSRYLQLLFEANATMNLTRIPDQATAEVQHIGDALTLLPHLPATPHTLADVGSGGGVPGIPLAIVRPDVRVTLIESTRKKATFLERVANELRLTNVRVLAQRAEDVGRSSARESFDVAIARAVATMDWLVEWCLPLLKKGGVMLAQKGPKGREELPASSRAIKLLGGGAPTLHPVDLPGTTDRVIVEIKKLAKTPPLYPRPATQNKGKPIG